MNAKDKAEQLYNDYYHWCADSSAPENMAKQCALISCDFAKEFITGGLSESFDKFLYLEDVKEEINKL